MKSTIKKNVKKAYFTMDDSPSKLLKEKVDILIEKKIPTLFFCQGNHLEQYPEQAIYAIQKGFVLGNHSYSHPKFSDISIEECLEEITKTDKILDDLYIRAKVKRGKKYFRYPKGIKADIPYGSLKILLKNFNAKYNAIEKHLSNLNYESLKIDKPKHRYPLFLSQFDTDCSWTLDIGEWKLLHKNKNYSIEMVFSFLERKLNGQRRNEIFLCHDHELTHVYFEAILDFLKEKKYDFQNIPI